MITEDYVSFEIAKLLKEKGFDEEVLAVYIYDNLYVKGENKIANTANVPIIPAPTLQMTMKWLREVHNVYVDISIYVITKNILKYNINVYYKKHKDNSMYSGIHITKVSSKYEEACEAAIKYCLENLI